MIESWDEYAKRKHKEFGVKEEDIKIIQSSALRFIVLQKKVDPKERRFNIHKRSIPPGIDKPVMFNFPSKETAEFAIENTTDKKGNFLFVMKRCQNDANELSTCIFYEPVPTDVTPKERSIYFNSGPITTRSIKGYKSLRRII